MPLYFFCSYSLILVALTLKRKLDWRLRLYDFNAFLLRFTYCFSDAFISLVSYSFNSLLNYCV